MEEIIRNLDYKGLESIWKVTFPNESIDDFMLSFDYTDEEDYLKEIRQVLIDEIQDREVMRQTEQKEHIESLMNMEVEPFDEEKAQRKEHMKALFDMEPQPEIKTHQQRRRKGKKFIEAIKTQHQKRQQRINKLHEVYNKQRDKDEDFYEWLRNKDAPADDENIQAFLDSIHLDSVIDFSTLNRNEREKVFETMKDRFEEVFGTLEITDNFLIHYRINGQWKSRTLTTDIWRQLMETLDAKEFVYSKESLDSGLMKFSDESEEGIFKFVYFDAISITPINDEHKRRKDNRSSFFKYFNTTDIDLSRYQIFPSIIRFDKKQRPKQIKALNDSCFIYALKVHGVSRDVLDKLRLRINTRKLGNAKMDALCDEFKIHVVVKDLEYTNDHTKFRVNGKNYFGCPKDEAKWCLTLNSFKDHYFIDEPTVFTTEYIKHKYVLHEDIGEVCYDKVYRNGIWKRDRRPSYFISSGKLVKLLFEGGHFKPMTYNNSYILHTSLYKEAKVDIGDLSYDPKYCTKLMEPAKTRSKQHRATSKPIKYTYFYADFEADATINPHRCYMCCVQRDFGGEIKTFKGEDADIQFLDYMIKFVNPVVYFHNLKYDFSFIAKYGITKSLQKGTRLMRASIEYKNTLILFRDTLPILNCKLSRLPQMFHFDGIQKEIFPYKYYTIERLKSNKGIIADAGVEDGWNKNDYKLFNENIDKIGCRVNKIYFDMYKYAEFYCKQDVNILRRAFNQFARDFKKEFNINPFD